MSVFGRLKNLFFSCTAQITQSSEDRPLFRIIREQKIRRIVEIGVGSGERALKMIEAAARNRSPTPLSYTGIDLFEARADRSAGLTMKAAYCKLRKSQAMVQLVPGDALSALSRVANTLAGTELLLVSADQTGESLERAWFYVPRLLTPSSTILIESTDPQSGAASLQTLSRIEVESRAAKARPRKAA